MKEEWLFHGAVVPIDVETTAALVAEIKRLIDVVGGLILNQGPHYERGFIDGMQKQMQSSVDKAVNRMAQPEQEPVALENVYETIVHWDEGGGKRSRRELARRIVDLYTAPPQRKPLTDEEIDQGLLRTKYAMQTAGAWRDGVEWAIKQLQERNT